MRQQPTQLNEVPWNEQTPAQRQQTLQRQQQQTQLQQQSRQPQSQYQSPPRQAQPQTAPTPRQSQPVQTTQQPTQQQQQHMLPQHSQQPKTEKPKEVEKEKTQRWMVQCGSFKGSDQAESVRASLAFEGFESKITSGGGWNRVIVGPYNSRSAADSTLKRLRGSGHSNCIPVSLGG